MRQTLRCGYHMGIAQGQAMTEEDGSSNLIAAHAALETVSEPSLAGARASLAAAKSNWKTGAPMIVGIVTQIQKSGGAIHNSVSAGYLIGVAFAACKYANKETKPTQILSWLGEAEKNTAGLITIGALPWTVEILKPKFNVVLDSLRVGNVSIGELKNLAQTVENLYQTIYNAIPLQAGVEKR